MAREDHGVTYLSTDEVDDDVSMVSKCSAILAIILGNLEKF